MKSLGIGLEVTTKSLVYPVKEEKEVSRRFIWLDSPRKMEKLSIAEIYGIGMFLQHGALYGKYLTDNGET